uniref:FAS1 domain-containing protein n=1 Tax=Brassica campestris TaxID=3711 RepID=M4DVI7_BRACM
MLQIIGKTRSRSACRYQKLSHHYEKATTRAIRHHEGKKIEGRSKGFRLNRPRKLVLKALVLPRRKMWWIVHGRKNKRNLHRDFENKSICDLGKDLEDILKGRLETIEEEPEAEEREWLGESHKPMLVKAKMKVEKGKAIVKAKVKSALFLFSLLTILATTVTEPRPTPILRHDNQSSDLFSAISDMRRESYYDLSQESLETFILRHRIPAWLGINHMLRFPNKTLVPCSIPDKMFTITKSGGSGLFVNNARIVSPNICQNSRISCHGVSNIITFIEASFSKGMLVSLSLGT